MAATTVSMQRVGSIALADLAGICQVQGRDGLPYPFIATGGSPSTFGHHHLTDTASVADRFEHGDLQGFATWAEAYLRADIWVECRVLSADGPATRILAYRAGPSGFLAAQRPDEDVVDVYRLSPHELGAAVAGHVGLTRPGASPRIEVPGHAGYFTQLAPEISDEEFYANFSVLRPAMSPARPSSTTVANAAVSALATIQSRCRPARDWGIDWTRKRVAWLRVTNDGDYIYAPDFGHATPATESKLAERIDRLIAADAADLRHQGRLD